MIAQPFFDIAYIKLFVTQEVIWNKISDDMHSIELYEPDMDDLWLACIDETKILGLCCFNIKNSISVGIHPYFPDNSNGRKCVIECLKWLKNQNIRDIRKVNATIPECANSVYNCAKKIGFIDEGINKQSFLKNGSVFDQHYLGLSLSEWSTGNE